MSNNQILKKPSLISKYIAPFTAVIVLLIYVFIFYFLKHFFGQSVQILTENAGSFLGSGLQNNFLWAPEGNLRLWIMGELSSQIGLMVILTVLVGFLLNYFVAEQKQRLVQIICSAVIITLIYGFSALIIFISAHYFIYFCFHGRFKRARFSPLLKIWATQLPVLIILLFTIINSSSTDVFFTLHIGVALLCWQWIRLMIYYLDESEGLVPSNISFIDYLAIFSGPGSVINLPDGFYIGQGYQYVMDRYSYSDRNKTILAGAKLLSIALIYVLIGPMIYRLAIVLIGKSGLPISGTVEMLVQRHVNGEKLSASTILLSCILGQMNWFIFYAGAVHARVGIWRLFGYNIDPHFNKPWLATNLVSLWERHTYHFRLALLRVSFFPLFFKFKKMKLTSRLSIATLGSAGLANMLWAHIPMYLLLYGLSFGSLKKLPTWPYYFLLSFGILITEIYLLKRKKRRKPWTLDFWLFSDVACAALTITYFCLIHVFARPVSGGSIISYGILFLNGLGISI